MTIIAGIEEAGRGPAIGPLVMCIALIEENKLDILKKIGVKDSKQLTSKIRKEIFDKLKRSLIYKVKIIEPNEIDSCLKSKISNLNKLEAQVSAELTNEMLKQYEINQLILDCPSINKEAYLKYFKKLIIKNIKIKAEHKADVNFPIVSAASIIAKCIRDEEIEKIKNKYNIDFGSGYPSDEKTINFLKYWYSKYKRFPDFVRKSWSTISRIKMELDQKKLDNFF